MRQFLQALLFLIIGLYSSNSFASAELVLNSYFVREYLDAGQTIRTPVSEAFIGDQLVLVLELQNLGSSSAFEIDLDHDIPENAKLIGASPLNQFMVANSSGIYHPGEWLTSEDLAQSQTVRWQISEVPAKSKQLYELRLEIIPAR